LVKQFLEDNSAEDVVDLTGQYDDLRSLLADAGVTPDAPWLGLEFIGDSEEPVSLSATNDKGLYRETGLIQLHVCAIAKIGAGAGLVTRGEVLRDLFRGARIGGIVVESVSPINTGPGATLEFEAGYVSGTVTVAYKYDLTPGA
jgi:hypothetical protein